MYREFHFCVLRDLGGTQNYIPVEHAVLVQDEIVYSGVFTMAAVRASGPSCPIIYLDGMPVDPGELVEHVVTDATGRYAGEIRLPPYREYKHEQGRYPFA